jgi:flagellar protein FliJ
MKPRESMLRLKRFEAEEKARKVADIEAMIREFEGMALDLERQIVSEEERTGIRDMSHFAYSTFAKAAAQRREKLVTSVDDLKVKLATAIEDRDAAMDGLQKFEEGDAARSTTSRPRRRNASGTGALAS